MLGIYRHRNHHWFREILVLPLCIFEVMSFGYFTIRDGKICRDDFSWITDCACLGTYLVIILSFGRLDCDWIEQINVL